MADFKLEIIDSISQKIVIKLFYSEPTKNDAINRMYAELKSSQNWPSSDGEYYAILYRLDNENYVIEDPLPFPAFKMENGIFTPITLFP